MMHRAEKTSVDWVVIGLVAVLLLSLAMHMAAAGEIEQSVADTSMIQQILDKCQSILDAYGWSLAGVFVSPFIVFRAVQYGKKAAKAYGKPLNRYLMDAVSCLAVGGLSYVFLSQDSVSVEQNLIISGIIAALHTVIVKAMFRFAPERVSAILTDGVYVDDETTMSKTILAAVVGKRGDQRSEPR